MLLTQRPQVALVSLELAGSTTCSSWAARRAVAAWHSGGSAHGILNVITATTSPAAWVSFLGGSQWLKCSPVNCGTTQNGVRSQRWWRRELPAHGGCLTWWAALLNALRNANSRLFLLPDCDKIYFVQVTPCGLNYSWCSRDRGIAFISVSVGPKFIW